MNEFDWNKDIIASRTDAEGGNYLNDHEYDLTHWE